MSKYSPSRMPFVVKQTSQGEMTAEQIGLVLACLAGDAMVIKDMAIRCSDNAASIEAVCNYCSVIGALVERMAWMADTTASALSAPSAIGLCDSPLDIFMVPAFGRMGGAA